MKYVLSIILTIMLMSAITAASLNKGHEAAAVLESTPDVFVITTVPPPTSTPTPELTPYITTVPEPTPTFELPDYDYPAEEGRCLSRLIWSGTPSSPTDETRQAYAEIPQNMVDDYKDRESKDEKIQYYKENIRYTTLMKTEFPSYDSTCYKNIPFDDKRRLKNDEIADYVMRSWYYATITGDRSYRLTPQSGVRYSFYNVNGYDYITVYDLNWNVVYDSGKF